MGDLKFDDNDECKVGDFTICAGWWGWEVWFKSARIGQGFCFEISDNKKAAKRFMKSLAKSVNKVAK